MNNEPVFSRQAFTQEKRLDLFSFFTQQGLIDMNGDGRPDYIVNNQILRNKSDGIGGQVSFGEPSSVLPDNANAFERQRSVGHRYDERPDEIRDNMTFRQAIDVNGDGRLDIIDASKLNQAWLIYLNTPDPNDPSKIVWSQRTYYTGDMLQRLRAAGAWTGDDHLPLAIRSTGHDHVFRICVKWNGGEWVEFTDDPETPGNCPEGGVFLSNGLEKTFTIWQLEDVNGDGYPDFVFNSGHVVTGDENILPPPPTNPNNLPRFAQRHVTVLLSGGDNNAVQAQLNIFGVMTRNGGDEPYSTTVTIQRNTACGFSEWVETDADHQQLVCGIIDVNGDGLPDLVQGTSVLLGTGGRPIGGYFTGSAMTLPGPLAIQSNPQKARCAPPATGTTTFEVSQLAGLRDLTGDGLPDYVFQDGAGSWKVAMGTGVSFASAVPISGGLVLSTETEDCAGLTSKTTAGLFDLDGDGSPDVVGRTGGGTPVSWRRLVGSLGTKGAPEAGRLVLLDNGYGAHTRITYQSAKEDKNTRHQIPFQEIVVSSVSVSGTAALGGDLAPTRYAYGGAELLFDPAADRFTFRGYRRSIELQVPAGQSEGVARLSETYGPASVTDPFGLGGPGSPAASSTLARYRTYLTAGRPKDVTMISGALGSDPWSLLDPNNALLVSRRVATTHYNWELRSLAKPSDPAGPEVCREMVFPYDRAASQSYAGENGEWDLCAAHGFGFAVNVESRRTEPDADLASSSLVATRTEIQSVDDFGRVLSEKRLNDLNQPNDDLCVVTTYATPTGTNERVLGAASTRSTTNCGSFTYAQDRWTFDGLAAGSVSAGFPTAHLVERRTDSGALERTIREFDATYDAFGNPLTMTTSREDGASRTATLTYDAFKLVPQTITTAATGVATTATSVVRDPVTLTVTSVTDANGTQHGSQVDGFLRPVLSTVTTPDGITGALSFTAYRGFSLTESGGRSVARTEFTDPVAVSAAPTATGRRATVFLDELGRSMRAEVDLGASYQNATLVAERRIYDSLGRVVFTADPFPSTQDFATAYGTTSIFNTDGTLSCSVRSKGRAIAPAATMLATDEANEFYPTCYTHVFQNKSEVSGVRDAASLLAGSPQESVTKRSEATAIGRVVSRSTFAKNGSRIEHALLNYDALGHLNGMTRFQDAANAARPVAWEWHTDSLGQIRQLDEPESVPQLSSYSDWGELTSVTRYIADGGGASLSSRATNATGPDDPPPPPSTVPLTILKSYDALGRLLHSEEQLNGVTDAATVNDYVYDTAVVAAPQVNATHVVGRLAQAISPTGAVSFSYDGFGQVNAQVFVDRRGGTYVEKHEFHGDGSAASLDLFLPDTTFANEHVDYQYDSAGRGRTVRYTSGSENRLLYSASNIDALGRVRAASYGEASYAAAFAELGRRLMTQASVTSASGSVVSL